MSFSTLRSACVGGRLLSSPPPFRCFQTSPSNRTTPKNPSRTFSTTRSSAVPRPIEEFDDYVMNVKDVVDKEFEGKCFGELVELPIAAIQGIADRGADALESIGVRTIRDLATSKYYKYAKAIVVLADKEVDGGREAGCRLNLDKAMNKKYQKCTFREMAAAPVNAFFGISPKSGEILATIGLKSVRDFANWKFAAWCDAIYVLHGTEQLEIGGGGGN